jgi:hypothetical protein|tara:strand:+ start:2675 stop:3445 length:771 start_codon:yes stop_codon:yes gene_type:complete
MLTIHINDNWLVFCVFINNKLSLLKKIAFLNEKSSVFILKSIKKFLKSNKEELLQVENVRLVYYNNSSTLVPSVLFDQDNSLNYLKLNVKISVNDFVTNDSLIEDEIKNIYIPYVNINNYIFEKYNSFEYHHYSTILIEEFKKRLSSDFNQNLFLNVNDKMIDIIYFDDGNLKFNNSFSYSTDTDILYYLLFTLEQLNLNTEKTLVMSSGLISIESELYALLYNYIQNIDVLDYEISENQKYNTVLRSNILLNLCK